MSARSEGQRDNERLALKVGIRERALRVAADLCGGQPFIMETHGGVGRIYDALYGLQGLQGVVFEKNPDKVGVLARQRPTWAVYEADCEKALAVGAGALWSVHVLDVDPHGDPWGTIGAFMESDRSFAPGMVVVVTDGVRQHARYGRAWTSEVFRDVVCMLGNSNIFDQYLTACEYLMESKAAKAGYRLDKFAGYHCGRGNMSHYLAVLLRSEPERRVGRS